MKQVILIVAVWLVAVNLFALVALNRVTLAPDTAYSWINAATYDQAQTWNPIPLHARWDSYWLTTLAQGGYRYTQGSLSNIVFFPLYPALIRAAAPLFAQDIALAGWTVSCLALIVACVLLYKLVREFHPNADPLRAVMLLLIFPTAFFLNAVYAEATFLALSVAALYAMRKERFWIAGLFGLLAALTRANGFILAVPLAWELARYVWRRKRVAWNAFSVLLPPLGTALFFLYHRLWFGNGTLFFEVEKSWGRAFAINADHLSTFGRAATTNLAIDIAVVVLVLIAAVFVMYRIRVSYGLYMLASLVVPIGTGTLISISRFALTLVPLFILGASIRNRVVNWGWVLLSTMLFALMTVLYVNWYWAG